MLGKIWGVCIHDVDSQNFHKSIFNQEFAWR